MLGPIGFSTNGLAVASDGTLYAGTTGGELVTINPVTGAGTLVGVFGAGLTSGGAVGLRTLYGLRQIGMLHPRKGVVGWSVVLPERR